MLYLRPYLIKQRDDQERRQLAKQVREEAESTAPSIESQEVDSNR